MGRQIDVDDITDTAGAAEILGLAHRNSVGQYRRQYADFPQPVKNLGNGRCLLWLRSEIEAWRAARPGRGDQ